MQDSFNGVINSLETQAQNNRGPGGGYDGAATQAAGGIPGPHPGVGQRLHELLGSVFAYPRQGTRVVERTTLDTGPEKGSETGDGAAIVEDAAVRHALNTWVRNSWRSRTRGRAARSRGGSLRR